MGQSISFGGGTMYLYDEDYKNIYEMKYSDAMEYLGNRTKEISGFESFKNGVQYPEFWKRFVWVWIYYTVMGLLCCILFVYVSVRRQLQFNNRLERGAAD